MFGPETASSNVAIDPRLLNSVRKRQGKKSASNVPEFSSKTAILPKVELDEGIRESEFKKFSKDDEGNSQFVFDDAEKKEGETRKEKRKGAMSVSEKRHIHLLNPGSGDSSMNYRKKLHFGTMNGRPVAVRGLGRNWNG